MSPRASIHRAAPYVLQLSTVSRVPAKTADGASGCNGAIGLTKRPSQTAVGRQTSTRIVARATRSEEHTSELQSRLHLVCRLLLEKKKILTPRPLRSSTISTPTSAASHES